MLTELLIVLALHSLAAMLALASAFRDGMNFSQSLECGGTGFVTGLLGLITRAKMDRRYLQHSHVLQDATLNLGMEAIAVFGLPFLLK